MSHKLPEMIPSGGTTCMSRSEHEGSASNFATVRSAVLSGINAELQRARESKYDVDVLIKRFR
jgi:hypothetical protein